MCWCARSKNELLAILRQFQTAFFFFFLFPTKSRVKAALTAETDIRVFIAERIIYHGRPVDLHCGSYYGLYALAIVNCASMSRGMNPVHVWRERAWNVRGFILRVKGGRVESLRWRGG